MQKSWLLWPGQTVENSRVQDRGQALILSKSAFKGITRHLDRVKLKQEIQDREQARKDYLRDGSRAMTKNWDNTVENIQKRRAEEREAKAKAEAESKVNRYLELRADQEEEKKRLAAEARKALYVTKDHPRNLNSALLLTSVLVEREAQKVFDKKLQNLEDVEEKKYADKVKADVEQDRMERAEKQRQIREKGKKLGEQLKNTIKERQEKEKREREEEQRCEMEDAKEAKRERELIEKYRREEDKKVKDYMMKQFWDFKEKKEQEELLQQKEQEEEDAVVDIYSKAKARIECLRKAKEKELLAELGKKQEIVRGKISSDTDARAALEENMLKKAQNEAEEREREKREERAAYDKKLFEERIQNRKEFLEKEERRMHLESEVKKWETLNRLKSDEMYKNYLDDKKKKNWEAVLEHRIHLLEQMKEKRAQELAEKQEDLEYMKQVKTKYDREDQHFLNYSKELLDMAKKKGWDTKFIEKVIEEYKILNGLMKKPRKICYNVRSNVSENDSNDDPALSRCKKCFDERLYK